MKSVVSKVRSLSWMEWRVVLSSLVMLPWCALCLQFKGLSGTRALFLAAPALPTKLSRERQLTLARSAALAVHIAAHHGPYRANCLKRSLVLERWLHRRGIESQLKIGADLVEGDLSAHAWVEFLGVVLNDRKDVAERFKPFQPAPSFPEKQFS